MNKLSKRYLIEMPNYHSVNILFPREIVLFTTVSIYKSQHFYTLDATLKEQKETKCSVL